MNKDETVDSVAIKLAPYFRQAVFLFSLLLISPTVLANASPPTFTKVFSPDTIGPGSSSTLTFTIDNSNHGEPIADLAFVDNLPAGVTLSGAPNASTSCTIQETSSPSAPAGEGVVLILTDSAFLRLVFVLFRLTLQAAHLART